MSDRLYVAYAFGGKISKKNHSYLLDLMSEFDDYDDDTCSGEQPYGENEEIEDFCSNNNVSFTRKTDAKYEYDNEYYEKIDGVERILLCDYSGEIVVPLTWIKENQEKTGAEILKEFAPRELPKLEVI